MNGLPIKTLLDKKYKCSCMVCGKMFDSPNEVYRQCDSCIEKKMEQERLNRRRLEARTITCPNCQTKIKIK